MEGLVIWLLLVYVGGINEGGADVTVFETEQACLGAKQVANGWFYDKNLSLFGTVSVDCVKVSFNPNPATRAK